MDETNCGYPFSNEGARLILRGFSALISEGFDDSPFFYDEIKPIIDHIFRAYPELKSEFAHLPTMA